MNRVLDSFLRGFGRSIGWKHAALLLLAVLGFLGMGEVNAQTPKTCAGFNENCTPDEARKACLLVYNDPAWRGSYVETNPPIDCRIPQNPAYSGKVKGTVCTRPDYCAGAFRTVERYWNATCPAGKQWNVGTQKCDVPCNQRPELSGLSVHNFQNGPTLCNFGCEYSQAVPQADTTITDGNNPSNSIRFGVVLGGKPTGNQCTRNDGRDEPPKPDEPPQCLTVGQDSHGPIQHCPKPDGGTCIVTGKGTRFCQPPPPGTHGPKVDTGREAAMSQSADANTPPQPPANRPGENFQQNSSSTVTNHITNNTSNTSSYTNTGTPNVNGAPVSGDGSGSNGTGQQEGGAGSGAGSGTGGSGEGEGTDMGPTNELLSGISETLDGIKGWWDGLGDEAGTFDDGQGEDVDPAESWAEEDETPNVDATGYGWGSTCPTPPQINIPGGGSLDWSLLCTMAGYFGSLILAAGYVQAAYVIGRA